MFARIRKALALLAVLGSLGVLYGCAEMEYVPGGQYFLYHKQLPESKRAIEAARAAGKDKQCPAEFQAAEAAMKEAYKLYYACHTQEAIAKANEAIAKANALCPAKPTPVPTPVPPPPARAAAPTVSLSAAASSVDPGSCTTLSWTTTGATSASIDPVFGGVEPNGSRQACPKETTRYTLTATGPGGSTSDSTTISVAEKPKPTDKLTIHVNFDTNKSDIRKADVDDLKKAEAFVRKYSNCKIEVDGYTDSTGNDKINNPLSE
ncbi:MAG: hypothetical protein ACM3NW_01675, partial [Syntrophomonadaceae bacterium]